MKTKTQKAKAEKKGTQRKMARLNRIDPEKLKEEKQPQQEMALVPYEAAPVPQKEGPVNDILRSLPSLRGILERSGLNLDMLIERLKMELDYLEPVTQKDGGTIYVKSVQAMMVRQRARQDAHRLRNDYPPTEQRWTSGNGEPPDPRPIRVVFVKSPQRNEDGSETG